MSSRLSGKVCVITGTGGSVGRAAALAFAREGASVVGCDVSVAAAEATVEMVRAQRGTMSSLQPCHLTEPADRRALQQRRHGVLQLARRHHQRGMEPRSAGRNRPGFFLTRAAWAYLKASRGVIVNTASLNGLMSFKMLGSLAHTTAKAGIIGMTRQLAMESREHGIRANSISPGLIETNQTREQLRDPVWASAMPGKTLLNCFIPTGLTNGVMSLSNTSYQPTYGTKRGYDFATGMGSVDVFNLVRSWPGSRLHQRR